MSNYRSGDSRTTDEREGRRIARLFRMARLQPAASATRRCDLDAILEEDCIEVVESELVDCGYCACLLRMPEGGGGIVISKGQDRGRRRFSLAHELGHYHIPSHLVSDHLSCADADLRRRSSDANRKEWEANDFATELLMPYAQFASDVGSREASFRTVATLAAPDMYDVSLTAAAWRLVQTTREPCALVVSEDGFVRWIVRSDAWRHSLPETRRVLPAGSAADAVARGESPTSTPIAVDPAIWLAPADGRIFLPDDSELLESTHSIPRLGQVISLLWMPDAS